MPFKLVINGYEPPYKTISTGDYAVKKNKIWSKNTGRSASGRMLGDIIAVKYTVAVKWEELSQAEVWELEKALSAKPFFPVTFTDEKGAEVSDKTFYSADMQYSSKYYRNGKAFYSGVSIELIEQ